jgi:CubicO group peptidase (beta-lactamase class C family)
MSPELPDTPAARRCGAWLEAFNGRDRAIYRAFLEQSFPSRLPHLEEELELREMTGGFALRAVEQSTATNLVALLQEIDSDQFARLTIEVESGEPHVITRLGLLAIPRPAGYEVARLSERELVAALRSKMNEWVAADRFSGAVLLARTGEVIHAGAYGLADRERQVANRLDTRFRIGSMTKMFTATAVLQLVQAGKLALDDPVGKHLTEHPDRDVAEKVTIQHLLTHTGGTGDIFGPQFDAHRLELRSHADYVALYGTRALAFAPGSRWEYSNYGFILLGRVIEKVSAQDYYEYVRLHIFKPAGMSSTASDPEDKAVRDRSVGYTKMDPTGRLLASWQSNADSLPFRGTSAGGGYSTVEDLLRFASALQAHALLDASHTELLTTGKVDTAGGQYAFGFHDHLVNGTRCFGHGGGAAGMNGALEICPRAGYVVAVLSNMDPMAAERVAGFVTSRLPP